MLKIEHRCDMFLNAQLRFGHICTVKKTSTFPIFSIIWTIHYNLR